jgi:hypothetical protein
MNPLASLLLSFAHALAPKADKVWIADMRLEAAFVPNKLSFALSALGLACKFRFAALRMNRPVGLAFASVALAAVATFLVVPNLFGTNDAATAAMSSPPSASYEEVQDIAESRGYSADAQETALEEPVTQDAVADVVAPGTVAEAESTDLAQATEPQAPAPQTTQTSPQNSTPETVAQPATELEPDLARVSPEATPMAEPAPPPAAITPPEQPAIPAPATTAESAAFGEQDNDEQAVSNSSGLGSENTTANGAFSAVTPEAEEPITSVPDPRTPDVDTDVISTLVRGQSVEIKVTANALLTLYRDTNFSGSPRLNRYVTAGETFTANVPFSLYTDNASAISITADGNTLTLGGEDEEQFRIFSKP